MSEDLKVKDKMKELSDEITSEIEKNIFSKDKLRGIIGDHVRSLENLKKTIDFQLPAAKEKEKEKISEIKDKIAYVCSFAKQELEEINDDTDKLFETLVDNIVKVKLLERDVDLINKSNSVMITLNSYYIYSYSILDSFFNELLRYIFNEKHKYLLSDEKLISYTKILNMKDFSKIMTYIINKEIEDIQRKSYVKQFTTLEKLFDINLKKFDNWSSFVENSQRRNLIVHCNGIVSEQYLSICKENGLELTELKVGDFLKIDSNYLDGTIDLLIEIVYKLGQTLWRKIFPEQLEEADIYLSNYVYYLLQNKNFKLALILGDFGTNLPKHCNDLTKKPIIINYAIALRETNNKKELVNLLDRFDWSSTIDDFKVAYFTLKEDFGTVFNLLRKIGKSGEFINEQAYLEWPLFVPLRDNLEFRNLFEEIYCKSMEQSLKETFEKTIDEFKD